MIYLSCKSADPDEIQHHYAAFHLDLNGGFDCLAVSGILRVNIFSYYIHAWKIINIANV